MQDGMTLRDYFAAQTALPDEGISGPQAQALMGGRPPEWSEDTAIACIDWWLAAEAKYRYAFADAMLRERGK